MLKPDPEELKRLGLYQGSPGYLRKKTDTLLEEENFELANLQNKLDELYCQKAKGAVIRSRAKWLKEGEQNSHYFLI